MKKIKRKNGFTLIELLSVIVILAIIALISIPIIIGVIEKARRGAFEDSAYGVIDAAKLYFTGKLADQNKFTGATFTFPGGGDLKVSGEKPAGGTLSLNTDGKQAIALYDKDKKWCAFKTYEEEKITIKDYKEDCKVLLNEAASSYIISKNTDANTEGLFTDDFGNTRYRGNDSATKNYVSFNNEVWRIIGAFEGKVKLIRDERISNPNDGSVPYDTSNPNSFKWDSHTIATGAESDNGKNDWTTSDLKDYLNTGYYNSLMDTAKNMIEETKYSLGGIANTSIDKKTAFRLERGTTVYSGRPTEWTGKIGLMYVSDYGYAAGEECTQYLYKYDNVTCKGNNWLYKSSHDQWSITPLSSVSSHVINIYGSGTIVGTTAGNHWVAVRPSLYLKSDVKIIGGKGTKTDPYLLSL